MVRSAHAELHGEVTNSAFFLLLESLLSARFLGIFRLCGLEASCALLTLEMLICVRREGDSLGVARAEKHVDWSLPWENSLDYLGAVVVWQKSNLQGPAHPK